METNSPTRHTHTHPTYTYTSDTHIHTRHTHTHTHPTYTYTPDIHIYTRHTQLIFIPDRNYEMIIDLTLNIYPSHWRLKETALGPSPPRPLAPCYTTGGKGRPRCKDPHISP